MAQSQGAGTIYNYRSDKANAKAVQSTDGDSHTIDYKPGKNTRDARRRVWERYKDMRDDPIRLEEEKQWELGRKMYTMWAPERAEDDWRADVILPDGFAAMQSHLQETINARFRPILEGVESSDEVMQFYNNSIFQHAMDTTEFDEEMAKVQRAASMMGTAFTREEYRYETREVQDPTGFKDGEIKYTKKEIIDFDDVYTRYVRPENCYFDNNAEDAKYGVDCIYREVLDWDTFQELYKDKPGFVDIDKVKKAGQIDDTRVGYFKMAGDMDKNDVEILHYEHKLTDSYDVLANNVMIRVGPMPNKHKQLSLDVWSFYPVEGRIYGMGIPRIIYSLMEERRTGRNMQLDRGILANSGMFLTNDLFDLDEDDLTPRPHGMISVNTNGLPIQDAILPLQYQDTPISAIRMDDTLLADERRATGMDDHPGQEPGGTATQAAIVKESTQLRINYVNTLQALNTLIRLGKKKWSNIQFFYPAPRIERVLENNKWIEKKKYRTIKTKGKTVSVVGDPAEGEALQIQATDIQGTSRFKLDPTYARFMLDDYDVVMDAQALAVVSKPIKQQQTNELYDRVMGNPLISRYIDGQKASKRMFLVNDENPAEWMVNDGMTDQDMRELAENENLLFLDMERTGKLYMIPGTPGANQAHTEIHLQFTRTKVYQDLPEPIQRVVANHILQENEGNPNTQNIADLMGGSPLGPQTAGGMDPNAAGPPQGGGGNAVPNGMPGGPDAGAGQGPVPGAPVAGGDVTAGNGPAPVA